MPSPLLQPSTLPRRARLWWVAALMVLTLGAACGSNGDDSTDDATMTDEAADTTGDATGDTADASDQPVIDVDGPANPENARLLIGDLIGVEAEADAVACLVERADGDSTLTAAINGVGTAGFSFTPEFFTALATGVHACNDNRLLGGSLLTISGADDDAGRDAFIDCAEAELDDTVDGDLTYTGLAAVRVGFPVPEGAQEATISSLTTCVPAPDLANRLANTAEQSSGFAIEVDRACVAESIDDSFTSEFWSAVVLADGTTPDIGPIVDDCSDAFSSGLPTEIPADFTPFDGSGALAAIDPTARNGVYASAPPSVLDETASYQAILTTADGQMVIDLFTDTAPDTVNNFVALAQDGFYDGTVFHRVLDGFMAQGGDPSGLGTGGPGYSFEDEDSGFTPVDRRGLLAMANSGPDTNGSQFFITFAPAEHLTGAHVVFGEVVDGDDVLAAIDLRDPNAPTSRGEVLQSVEIVRN